MAKFANDKETIEEYKPTSIELVELIAEVLYDELVENPILIIDTTDCNNIAEKIISKIKENEIDLVEVLFFIS